MSNAASTASAPAPAPAASGFAGVRVGASSDASGGPRLTVRRHVDLVRVASAVCRVRCRPVRPLP
ncbi:putative leader peptide [Actinomadura sp. 9N215]|uniref:putative leader peptide n=1 Tax=Actinomadura sp. 9N215 TaxID=3375150 RepID=UPI0037A97F44